MKISAKFILVLLLFFTVAMQGLAQTQTSALLEEFEFQGQKYSIYEYFSPPRVGLTLKGSTNINLSTGLDGENILLGNKIGKDNFYVFWLNYQNKTIRLAYYDYHQNRRQVLSLAGFTSFGLPEILEANGEPQALVFLGNNSNNLDIFHYELATELLTPLTKTPFSEKNIVLHETGNVLEIETSSLWATYRYRFDPSLHKCVLLEKKNFPARKKKRAGAITPEYYNTYIGFGDSITVGYMEGSDQPELCYLTQMRDIYLPEIYGPAEFINLGISGNGTKAGKDRVDQDLDNNTGFYFLLMLGVNDVWNEKLFDKDSSLENLEFIIDAALARDMRVIVSTLTPRKDSQFVYEDYYWDNLWGLSKGILALAKKKHIISIDTLKIFMNTNPPDGWKDLLETRRWIGNLEVKGNHPNAKGHRVIADLFATALAAFPPLPPSGIIVTNPQDHLKKKVQWDANYESDFSHFAIEFAFKPDSLSHHLTTVNNYFTFPLFPFLPKLYFRLQTVDRGNRTSAFSTVISAQTGNFPREKQRRQYQR